MFCTKCGNEIPNDAKSCPACGAPVEGFAAPEAPLAPESAAGGAPRKGMNRGVVLGIAAVALALLIALAVTLLNPGKAAKSKLDKALAKSAAAYETAAEALGAPDFEKLSESKKISQSGSFEVRSIAGLDSDMIKGLGFRFASGYDLKGKKMDLTGTAFFGSADLIGAQLTAEDNLMYLYVPELFGDTAYGVDTTTLGADLDKLSEGELPEEYANLSFNLFDLLETLDTDPVKPDKEAEKALRDAIEVKKAGSATVEVNGQSLKCDQYHVVIPKDAMKDYVDAAKNLYNDLAYDQKILEVLHSIGLPEDVVAEIEDSFEEGYGESSSIFDEIKDFVKELGDLELEVYVNGGYVSAVTWEGTLYGANSEFAMYLGGGKNYVDDLKVELRSGDDRCTLTSTGDHAVKSGTFTDALTLNYHVDEEDGTIESELSYTPAKATNNFNWSVKAAGQTFKSEGLLTMNKSGFDMQLDELSLAGESGEKLFSARASWAFGPYDEQKLTAAKTTLLSSMSRGAMEDLVEEISNNTMSWAQRVYEKNEDLFGMLSLFF